MVVDWMNRCVWYELFVYGEMILIILVVECKLSLCENIFNVYNVISIWIK